MVLGLHPGFWQNFKFERVCWAWHQDLFLTTFPGEGSCLVRPDSDGEIREGCKAGEGGDSGS